MSAINPDLPYNPVFMSVTVVQLSSESTTCAWVQCLRFVRRAQSLKDARQTFLKASKVPDIGWQVCSCQSCASLATESCKLTQKGVVCPFLSPLNCGQQLRQEAMQPSLTCASSAPNLLLHTLPYKRVLTSQQMGA